MELALKITQMVAPVIAMIGLGCLCRKKQYIDHKGLAGLKGLIGNITLPAVLFNAFLTASYSMRVLLVFAVVCGIWHCPGIWFPYQAVCEAI